MASDPAAGGAGDGPAAAGNRRLLAGRRPRGAGDGPAAAGVRRRIAGPGRHRGVGDAPSLAGARRRGRLAGDPRRPPHPVEERRRTSQIPRVGQPERPRHSTGLPTYGASRRTVFILSSAGRRGEEARGGECVGGETGEWVGGTG